jgi:hypothetical protein
MNRALDDELDNQLLIALRNDQTVLSIRDILIRYKSKSYGGNDVYRFLSEMHKDPATERLMKNP